MLGVSFSRACLFHVLFVPRTEIHRGKSMSPTPPTSLALHARPLYFASSFSCQGPCVGRAAADWGKENCGHRHAHAHMRGVCAFPPNVFLKILNEWAGSPVVTTLCPVCGGPLPPKHTLGCIVRHTSQEAAWHVLLGQGRDALTPYECGPREHSSCRKHIHSPRHARGKVPSYHVFLFLVPCHSPSLSSTTHTAQAGHPLPPS